MRWQELGGEPDAIEMAIERGETELAAVAAAARATTTPG